MKKKKKLCKTLVNQIEFFMVGNFFNVAAAVVVGVSIQNEQVTLGNERLCVWMVIWTNTSAVSNRITCIFRLIIQQLVYTRLTIKMHQQTLNQIRILDSKSNWDVNWSTIWPYILCISLCCKNSPLHKWHSVVHIEFYIFFRFFFFISFRKTWYVLFSTWCSLHLFFFKAEC